MEENTLNNVLITGARGFVGSALQEFLTNAGYRVHALDRKDPSAPFYFDQQEKEVVQALAWSGDSARYTIIDRAQPSLWSKTPENNKSKSDKFNWLLKVLKEKSTNSKNDM